MPRAERARLFVAGRRGVTGSGLVRLAAEPPGAPLHVGRGEEASPALFSPAALEALYRQQAGRLIRRFARSLGGADAGDVVHDAFAKLAVAKANADRPVESPEALVAVAATNALRDRARAAARQALHYHQLAADTAASVDDPHRYVESREVLRSIERALAAMNPRRRGIFMMHRFEHMSYAEIGREVGMSEKAIKKQMAKALVELRRAAGPI